MVILIDVAAIIRRSPKKGEVQVIYSSEAKVTPKMVGGSLKVEGGKPRLQRVTVHIPPNVQIDLKGVLIENSDTLKIV